MVCTAIKNCSTGALSYVDDENEPLGGLIVINYDLCEECGTCSKVCCGSAIDLQ
jgi:ferredoxin